MKNISLPVAGSLLLALSEAARTSLLLSAGRAPPFSASPPASSCF